MSKNHNQLKHKTVSILRRIRKTTWAIVKWLLLIYLAAWVGTYLWLTGVCADHLVPHPILTWDFKAYCTTEVDATEFTIPLNIIFSMPSIEDKNLVPVPNFGF